MITDIMTRESDIPRTVRLQTSVS
ncbi:hypothetical protein SUNI508_14100 [Seiridium unicorne]|uniref:Uncharacterized protein n=1 Tax=Seiridium unicorne TaxID=138068 RepID=A0ABR2UYJ4_9PEZI